MHQIEINTIYITHSLCIISQLSPPLFFEVVLLWVSLVDFCDADRLATDIAFPISLTTNSIQHFLLLPLMI